MKKVFKILSACSLSAVIAAAASVSAFAAGINPAEQKILDELNTTVTMQGNEKHLPVSYVNQAENYMNTVEITEEEANLIIERIEATKAYLTSTGAANYNEMTDEQIDTFFSMCQDVVSVIDLTVTYTKSNRVVNIVDKNGKVVFNAAIGSDPKPIPTDDSKPSQDSKPSGDIVDPNPIKTTGLDFNIPGVVAVAGTGVLLVSAAGVYLVTTKKKTAEDRNA